ncbi:MAG: hypothetical protein GWO24_11350, partial [Akkermansiaceae bacterium]|nr:hypothetical protein [Akkermansiaceae bacterium]
QFAATARAANGSPVTDVSFVWLSSDRSVVTIDSEGLALALGEGTVTVSATARDVSGEATLVVD